VWQAAALDVKCGN